MAFYDDDKPERDPFQGFLGIRHGGRLANSPYTKLDEAMTLLYNHIPADVATEILSPEDGPYSFPRSGVAGIGVMNGRCVAVEIVQVLLSLTST